MRGRPLLFTSYQDDQALLPTTSKRIAVLLFLALLIVIPLGFLPGLGFLGSDDWLRILSRVAIFVIAALGLNILTGLAGQVSLGHAFFMGIGAYTAAVLGAAPGALIGFGLPMVIWLPAAGLVAALVGALIAPTAVRVRGLYLAIVTLGLVFIGEYLFRNLASITGGSQAGRSFPPLQIAFGADSEPLISFTEPGPWLGIELSAAAKSFYLLLAFAIIAVLVAKNLQRTRVGRAFMAIRDRDIAAEVMGVNEFRHKLVAFAISSFFAGIAGALLASFLGRVIPETWDLFLSVQIIAMILIGGAGTVTGAILGSAFVIVLPRLVQDFTNWLAALAQTEGFGATVAGVLVSTGPGDFGLVNTLAGTGPGLNVSQANLVIYGLLIIGFLIFEPLGLYGIWIRIRNYWKGWPFTY